MCVVQGDSQSAATLYDTMRYDVMQLYCVIRQSVLKIYISDSRDLMLVYCSFHAQNLSGVVRLGFALLEFYFFLSIFWKQNKTMNNSVL